MNISNILQVNIAIEIDKYLGLPSMIGRSKKDMFKFIKDQVWRKINSWGGRSLSKAGKEVMIKSALQSIPTYFMSIFLIPSSLGDEIEKMMNSFWWGNGGNRNKGIRWLSWYKLYVHKRSGGMGFKNLYMFNMALLGKQVWRLMCQPELLVARLFKARYYQKNDIFEAKKGNNSSYVWKSIHEAIPMVKQGTRWKIGNKDKIRVFQDRWLMNGGLAQPAAQYNQLLQLNVKELLQPGQKSWNLDVLQHYLTPHSVCEARNVI